MTTHVCSHESHEGQPAEKRQYHPGSGGTHQHKILAGHRPVPAATRPTPVAAAPDPAPTDRHGHGPDGLTDHQRTLRRLHNAGIPHTEIGRQLGITANSVSSSVSRLRRTGRLA